MRVVASFLTANDVANAPAVVTVANDPPGWCDSPLCPVALGAGVVAVVGTGVVTMVVVGERR